MTHEPQDFQLDPKDFHTGNWLVDGQIKKLIKIINEADLNEDGKRDIGQLVSIFAQLLPLLAVLNNSVDHELLADRACSSPAVIDKVGFRTAIYKLGQLAEETKELLPK